MDPQSASNPRNVSSVAEIRERLLARTFNGLSRFTTAEMTAIIEERLARARAPIAPERVAELTGLAEKYCPKDESPALDQLNRLERERAEKEGRNSWTQYSSQSRLNKNSPSGGSAPG